MRNHARALGLGLLLACTFTLATSAVAGAKVLLVGKFHGVKGDYTTIQSAVNAAKQGDWILVGPGDYKTSASSAPKAAPQSPAGILMSTPNVTLRGMSRSKVIVDGTKPGSAPCSKSPSAQNYGPTYNKGKAGLNGIEVWEANDVNVENLTACNFLSGTGDTGNGIWWNGGAGLGRIHGWGFIASYLNGTATYFPGPSHGAGYGLFSSDWSGGLFDHDYASNMDDSGFYIGGCAQLCNQEISNSQSEFNALGYSGTNSGGSMLIENNEFDQNQDGFDTNSQNNSDWPSPQNGACAKNAKPSVSGATNCWVLYHNLFYDNNNPNVPAVGSAAAGPVGTGVSIEGRNDSFIDNTFKDDNAWGIVFEPYPDLGTPPANVQAAGKACAGGTSKYNLLNLLTVNCMYDDWGNQVLNNTFTDDGSFGNPTNGDIAELTLLSGNAINCYNGNTDTDGTLTTSPLSLQTTNATCGTIGAADGNQQFLLEAACDTEALGLSGGTPIGCSPTDNYPRETKIVMHPLPKNLATMPNPCKGVPNNPWCVAGKPK